MIRNFIQEHLSFKISFITGIAITLVVLIYPSLFLPEQFGYENSLIENIQLIVLLIGFIMSIRTKNKFFNFVANGYYNPTFAGNKLWKDDIFSYSE